MKNDKVDEEKDYEVTTIDGAGFERIYSLTHEEVFEMFNFYMCKINNITTLTIRRYAGENR
jgi:hypothetical protein